MVAIAIEWAEPATQPPWYALTCQVMGLGWQRGATEDRGPMTVPTQGNAQLYLVDPNRDLDPYNAAGAWYPKWQVGAILRVTMESRQVFFGRVDSVSHALKPPVPGYEGVPIARVSCVDYLAQLARVTTIPSTFAAQTSNLRIQSLMANAQFQPGTTPVQVGSGFVNVQAGGLVNDLWSDALAVTQNELGSIEFLPVPQITFASRSAVWTTAAPTLHIGCDDPDSSAELALDSLELLVDQSTVRNYVAAARAGGTARPVQQNAASIAKYGLRTTQRNDLILTTDADVDAWMALVLAQAKDARRGVLSAQVTAAGATAVGTIENVPLFRGRVHLYQDHYGSPIDVRQRLLGVSWQVDDQARATASLVLGQDAL